MAREAGLAGQAGDGLIERLQILVGGHGGREGLDVALEVREEQAVVMKCAHFLERLRGIPVAEGKAIEGHHDAGAIGAHAAMDEGLAIAVGAEQSEQGNDLLVGRLATGAPRQAYKSHAERFHLSLLVGHVLAALGIESHDRVDAHLFQLGIGGGLGLRATIQVRVHLAEIIDPGNEWFAIALGILRIVREGNAREDQEQAGEKNQRAKFSGLWKSEASPSVGRIHR